MNPFLVPVHQVIARDGRDGSVFSNAGVWILRPISELCPFTARDAANVVITARDPIECLVLREINLLAAELRIPQQIVEDLEYIVKIGLKTGEADRRGINAPVCFHLRCAYFEVVVELVAGLCLGSAGSPDLSVDIDQANFFSWFKPRSITNARQGIDDGELMILLQKDHHSVGQLNPFWFLRVERMQCRNWNLLPSALCQGKRR